MFCPLSHGKSLQVYPCSGSQRERTEFSKPNNEFGSFSKQSKNSGIGGGLIPVTPLINEILNILSKAHELNEKQR